MAARVPPSGNRKRSGSGARRERAATSGAPVGQPGRVQRASATSRRFRRSPTTAFSRTATPARWWPPTGRSSGCACPTSTRRRCSARCSIAAPAAGASGPTALYVPAGRRYIPGTNMIETTWMTPQGWIRVVDALAIGEWHDNEHGSSHTRPPTDFDADHLLVRMIECVQGQVQVEIVCEPMLDYGATPARVEQGRAGRREADAHDAMRWTPPTARRCSGCSATSAWASRATARTAATRWSRARNASARSPGRRRAAARTPPSRPSRSSSAPATSGATWLAEGTYPDHPWRRHLQRSALVLKGLTFMPTGALVAAPTTSLPETPGGERNWDYRYCWMRDASFTLWALHALGLDWEADDFIQYVADVPRNEDGSLQIMYGIRGEKDLEESTLDHLKGYEGARPVRIGNGAYNQRQNDVFGAVLDSVYLHSKQRDHIPERLWPVLIDQVQMRGGGVEGARPGDLGGARQAPALRLLEADVLGRAGPRRAPGRTARRRRERPKSGRRSPMRSATDILDARRRLARRLSPALRHRRARRVDAARAAACASCRPTTSACARP